MPTLTIPEQIAQCKIDGAKIRKRYKAVTTLFFKFDNIPLSQIIENRELSARGMDLYKSGDQIALMVACPECDIFFKSDELTETEIVAALYPPQP